MSEKRLEPEDREAASRRNDSVDPVSAGKGHEPGGPPAGHGRDQTVIEAFDEEGAGIAPKE